MDLGITETEAPTYISLLLTYVDPDGVGHLYHFHSPNVVAHDCDRAWPLACMPGYKLISKKKKKREPQIEKEGMMTRRRYSLPELVVFDGQNATAPKLKHVSCK